MNKTSLVCASLLMALAETATAGGLLTNTNQNIAFLRNPARDAAIGIDGVYSNPAGVAFMKEGLHLSFNFQNVHQTRTVTTDFAGFMFGEGNNGNSTKTFEGSANAPVLPSFQAAYNKNDWSFQFNFAVTGGGGKCVFDNGLPSFESQVALLPMFSQHLDQIATMIGLGGFGLDKAESYRMDTYMRGRQYYYGFTLGAARKINEHLSVYGGMRLLYGTANYYGYVNNIEAKINGAYVNANETFAQGATQASMAAGQYAQKAAEAYAAGQMTAYQELAGKAKDYTMKAAMLQTLSGATEDVNLNCNQTGWGIAPILGVDYKFGNFNLAAKYEFKTSMTLQNESANSKSAERLTTLDKYKDGQNVSEDSPALLTVGAQWSVLPELRVNAGWHHYFDKNASQFNDHQKKLDGNTNEYLFGAEYDITKAVQVSAGTQLTRYRFTDAYMEDISFNVSSYSFGFGVGIKLSEKMKLNLAYFQTNYSDYNRESQDYNNISATAAGLVQKVAGDLKLGDEAAQAAAGQVVKILTTPDAATGRSMLWGSDSFTRTNRVLGIGLDITL